MCVLPPMWAHLNEHHSANRFAFKIPISFRIINESARSSAFCAVSVCLLPFYGLCVVWVSFLLFLSSPFVLHVLTALRRFICNCSKVLLLSVSSEYFSIRVQNRFFGMRAANASHDALLAVHTAALHFSQYCQRQCILHWASSDTLILCCLPMRIFLSSWVMAIILPSQGKKWAYFCLFILFGCLSCLCCM